MSLFLKRIFCTHDHEKINEFIVPSEIDNVIDAGIKPHTHLSSVRKYVTDYQCKKCGKYFRKIVSTDKF